MAWQQLRGFRLKPWELRALLACDRAYLARCGELAKAEADANNPQAVSDEPMTPALFDRMFK